MRSPNTTTRSKRLKSPRSRVQLLLDPDKKLIVSNLATIEKRTEANMCEVLLCEALAARGEMNGAN